MATRNDAGSDEDLYGDSNAQGNQDQTSDQKGGDYESFILPRAVLEGKDYQPGDDLALRIVSIKGDRVEVQCAGDEEKEEGDKGMAEKGEGAAPEGGEGGNEGGGNQMAAMYD